MTRYYVTIRLIRGDSGGVIHKQLKWNVCYEAKINMNSLVHVYVNWDGVFKSSADADYYKG